MAASLRQGDDRLDPIKAYMGEPADQPPRVLTSMSIVCILAVDLKGKESDTWQPTLGMQLQVAGHASKDWAVPLLAMPTVITPKYACLFGFHI
jgi:hypothetical protein